MHTYIQTHTQIDKQAYHTDIERRIEIPRYTEREREREREIHRDKEREIEEGIEYNKQRNIN